jgi:uncharacterized protein (DUF4415 family)
LNRRKVDPECVDSDNPEWTEADFRNARPAAEILPASLARKLGVRGPQKAPTKEQINIRLSRTVLDAFRDSGAGWQTRLDEALQDWLKTHRPA